MMETNILPCIGSSDLLIREYVHDFGLVAWNLVALEDHLRLLLKDMAVLRAQWPMKMKKLRKIMDHHEEMTLGGLITEYARLGGKPELAANLRGLNETRRVIMHNRIPLLDPSTRMLSKARVGELQEALQEYSRDLLGRSNALQKAHHEVFEALVERAKREQPPTVPGAISISTLLGSHARMVRDFPEA